MVAKETLTAQISQEVDSGLIERAVSALLKHHNQKSSSDADSSSNALELLGNDEPVHVQFTLSRVPGIKAVSAKPIRIDIPNSLHKVNPSDNDDADDHDDGMEELEVCLIVKDEAKQHVKELISSFPTQMSYIKKKYSPSHPSVKNIHNIKIDVLS